MTVTFDAAKFRQQIPAYSANPPYTDDILLEWWNTAINYISDTECGSLNASARQRAINLMMAHLIFIDNAIIAGKTITVAQSATIGRVSVGIVPPPTKDDAWSWWIASTTYGQRLWAMLSVASVGGNYFGGSNDRAAFRGMVV